MKLHKKVFCVVGLGLLLFGTNLLAAEKTAKDVINNAYQYILDSAIPKTSSNELNLVFRGTWARKTL